MDQNNQATNQDDIRTPTDQSVPAPADEAGEDIGEAPKPEQTIDLEKELGEDIHLPRSAPAPTPQKGPSLAEALKSVQTQGAGKPFVSPTPLRDIPHVPSEAPVPQAPVATAPQAPVHSVPPREPKPPAVPPTPKEITPAPATPHIAVMHPEAATPIAKPEAPTHQVAQTPHMETSARAIDAAQATTFLGALEKVSPPPTVATSQETVPPPPVSPAKVAVPKTTTRATPSIVGAPKQRLSIVDQLRGQSASPLHPLRTYKTDAEESVRNNRTSLVTMAAAEEERRNRTSQAVLVGQEPRAPFPFKRLVLGTLTALFIVGGCAAAFYVYVGPPTVDTPTTVQASNILYVDESTEQSLVGLDHVSLTNKLTEIRDATNLSLGLVREVYFTLPNEGVVDADAPASKRLATTQEVLGRLAPTMPPELLRALLPEFILGIHVFDGNQGLIVLRSDSYQQAFSGMLNWELSMRSDLLPFMDRRPRPRLPNETTNATTTARVIASSFVDRVVRNHDARVLYNNEGDIVLLYAFIDQRTIAITTNESTLFEIASRLRDVRF